MEKRAESLVQAMERAAAVMKEIHSLASRVEADNVAIEAYSQPSSSAL